MLEVIVKSEKTVYNPGDIVETSFSKYLVINMALYEKHIPNNPSFDLFVLKLPECSIDKLCSKHIVRVWKQNKLEVG